MGLYVDAAHYDEPVSGFLASAGQNEDVFVSRARLPDGASFVPEISVGGKNFEGLIWSYPLKNGFGDGSKVGARGLKRAEGEPHVEVNADPPLTTRYLCEEDGAKTKITSEMRARTKVPLVQEAEKAGIIRNNLLISEDLALVEFLNGNQWPTTTVAAAGGGGVQWTAGGAGLPTRDGLIFGETIRAATGVWPDYGFISYDVLEVLRQHPETLKIFGSTANGAVISEGSLDDDELVLRFWARKWRLKYGLKVLGAQYNTANFAQSVTLSDISSGLIWLGCRRGILGSNEQSGGVRMGTGPASFIRVRERLSERVDYQEMGAPMGQEFVGSMWRDKDRKTDFLAGSHSFGFVTPAEMANTALRVTAAVAA